MNFTGSLLIICYFIITCAVIDCQISEQQSCMDEKQVVCQSVLDEKVNHLTSGIITPELCCPVIEARNCLRSALKECGFPKSSDTMLRPAECVKYDNGETCDNGTVVAEAPNHGSHDKSEELKEESEAIENNIKQLSEDTNHNSDGNNNENDMTFTVAEENFEHREEDTIKGNQLEHNEDKAMSESKHSEADSNENNGAIFTAISPFCLFIAIFLLISRS